MLELAAGCQMKENKPAGFPTLCWQEKHPPFVQGGSCPSWDFFTCWEAACSPLSPLGAGAAGAGGAGYGGDEAERWSLPQCCLHLAQPGALQPPLVCQGSWLLLFSIISWNT